QALVAASSAFRSSAFRFLGLRLASYFFVACRPKRMFVAAASIRIGLGRDILSRGPLALLERIWIGSHDFFFLELDRAFFCGSVFASDELLRSASFKSTGTPCFLRTSANASSASSWMVAIRSRPSCFSLSKVSSSKAINLRTCCVLQPRLCQDSSRPDKISSSGQMPDRCPHDFVARF